ncbi:replication initiation and membrane attachment family protein [Bacillus massilinigeriensis]|uniref:replication initiation and membrane attachment family protein n=1 Tax=Bacillus massilionigeriensis TaxID=1805475 RepID=UPI00096B01A3|nr:DnaD domain protein [Bacillus massilionigeriensis]
MMQLWNKLRPIDRYVVTSNGLLQEYDRRILTFLYQPLIGMEPYGLYMNFWCELEENRLRSSTASLHRDLMHLLGESLSNIYHWRLKLEGIGLLKTFIKETEEERLIIYELQPPPTPEIFFNSGALNIYLKRKVGEKQYIRLKRFFSDRIIPKEGFQEATVPFEEVYTSLSDEALQESIESEKDLDFSEERKFIGSGDPSKLFGKAESFIDMNFIIEHSKMIPAEAFTPLVKRTIGILAFVYGIDVVKMQQLVLDAFQPNTDEISVSELKENAKVWYQFNHNDKLPLLVDKIHPPMLHSLSEPPSNKEEEHIYYLETTSSREFLTQLSGGAEPSLADLKLIEEIMSKQKLEPGVMNVLIEFAMIKHDMKLSKAYIEKIASHWARKKIKTAKEAIEYTRKQDKENKENAQNNSRRVNSYKKKPIRTEVIPDWFKNKDQEATKMEDDEDFDFEIERRKLEEELKQLRNGGDLNGKNR